MVETCLRRLRLDRESMSLSATLMKRECREMCCVPTCRPVVDRCLNPVVVQGGGLAHTHANGYHDSQLMGCQPSGCCCNSIWAGWRVCPGWTRKVSWRPPVKQATGSEGAISVCSGRKTRTCVPPHRKGRAYHSNRKGNGQRRPDGEHNDVFLYSFY